MNAAMDSLLHMVSADINKLAVCLEDDCGKLYALRLKACPHCGSRAGFTLACWPGPLPKGWERRGHLISVCAWCVAEGAVAAPPMALRTDGICPAHVTVLLKRLKPGEGEGVPHAVPANPRVDGITPSPTPSHYGRTR